MWICKNKKQKCRTGPDCGWNMKPAQCDIFYNCKFNEVDMKHDLIERMKKCCVSAEWQQKNRTELLKTLSEFLKNAEPYDLHFLNEYIDDKKPRAGLSLTAETIAMLGATNFKFDFMDGRPVFDEPEPSAAEPTPFEIWKNSDPRHTWWPWWFNPSTTVPWKAWSDEQTEAQRQAHEAGQKHGAGVERERYSEIVELCRYMTRHVSCIFAQSASSNTYQKLEKALKNLESDTEPESSAELHKETQGLLQELISMINHFNGCSPTQSEFSFLQLILDMLSTRYKITPIKD